MTDGMMSLRTVEKIRRRSPAQYDSFAADEIEIRGLTGAAFGEKRPERLSEDNGHRDRAWEVRGILDQPGRLPGQAWG